MGYRSLQDCVNDLEKNGHLVRIKEEVDPNLEMTAIHQRVFASNGPAVLYENIKGTEFPAVSNLFGTSERSQFMFRDTLEQVKKMIGLKNDPLKAIKHPLQYASTPFTALTALPKRSSNKLSLYKETRISQLPLIKHWPEDGGAFITLPAVLTEDIEKPGLMNSNLGMYRIQMNGNEYVKDKEVGLHYQIQRGIGVHHSKAMKAGIPLKVSIFVGGPPSHIFSAVMPLPEGISELTFAGALGRRRFRYTRKDGYMISCDADFVIIGEVHPNEVKPEGPFGDHLGYYSLKHDYPVMRVHKVFHRKNAIWPFTLVGRPPQEDSSFGKLIHELTGEVIPQEIPGLLEVQAVDATGVHPLLLAIGSERYAPYKNEDQPQEILTLANHILGTGQMSLAKYLFIVSPERGTELRASNTEAFFKYLLERIDINKDVHFQTNTTIDTLDYSGTGLNSGSKVIFAAAGTKKRELGTDLPQDLTLPSNFSQARIPLPGVLTVQGNGFGSHDSAKDEIQILADQLGSFTEFNGSAETQFPIVVICDDSEFCSKTLNNFLWVTFTRSNPSHDIYGVKEFTRYKHWGCEGSLIIDARSKPHHAPPLEADPDIEKKVDRLGVSGGSLHGII